jgi:hypothetical protein
VSVVSVMEGEDTVGVTGDTGGQTRWGTGFASSRLTIHGNNLSLKGKRG